LLGVKAVELTALQMLEQRYVMPTYKRAPVEFVRGEGARLWDAEGKEYLDFVTGISVSSVGHCHPAVVEAVREQAERLIHVSNLFYSEPAVRLAERLCEASLGGKAFFTNSGTEANECAIKLARKHAHGRGIAEPEVVSLERAFHGRTMGSLAATPGMAANPSFAPMLAGFRSVPIDDPGALRAAVGPSTAAVMIEPILGEAGVYPVSDEMLVTAREACDESGALLILDEIQSGMGRTGSLWAFEQTPVRPDLMTTAKALGGGLPIGACLASPDLADVLQPGDHGSTFAAGPMIATAALAVLDIVDDQKLLHRVRDLGASLREELGAIEGVRELRGRGLMIGVGLEEGIDAGEVTADLLTGGLVVNQPEPGSLRLLPPLVVGRPELERAVELIRRAVAAERP
jgi:predicted acetylornithine/succinylornithine family transaminase